MSTEKNFEWIFTKFPTSDVNEDVFSLREIEYPSTPSEGQLLLRATYISVDPYMRLRMAQGDSYFQPFVINEAFTGGVTAEVVASNAPEYQPGDKVIGFLSWKKFQLVNLKHHKELLKLPNDITSSYFLGSLGMPALSAYFPLTEYAKLTNDSTVFVSGASGAVGLSVGQISKVLGVKKLVGSAGSAEKLTLAKEVGQFDDAINYRTEDLDKALKERFPDGIDVYWDNVGGSTLETVLKHMRNKGRIICCGAISQYNPSGEYGVKNLYLIMSKRLTVQGFIVSDWADRYPEANKKLVQWYYEGKIIPHETVLEGFENIPRAFLGLFKGDNQGKMIIKV